MGVEKCRGCAYLNPIMFHCGKYLRGIETAMYLCPTAKPQTNADRIRSMTDEELADLYMKAIEDEEYPGWWGNRMGLLAWLKQEASDGEIHRPLH